MQDSLFANQHKNLIKYDNFGVSFDYPDDYMLEEQVLEEGHYFTVDLDKEDETTFQSVQIDWLNNPQKYDPIDGRQRTKDDLMSVYGRGIRILKDYETILNEETVYWTDYVLEQEEGQIYLKTGVTRIDDYVFFL